MIIDRDRVKTVFKQYTDAYDVTDEKIKLKIDHTYRVANLCERIAVSLDLNREEVDLAWLLGMLHDVGRFEQLRQFGTFSDADSVDHAALGADILFCSGRAAGDTPQRMKDKSIKRGSIREYVDDMEEDSLIETAIRVHSAYRVPEELDDRTKMFCVILRDADKIDILKVNIEVPLEAIYNTTTEAIQNADITEEVLNSFFEHHAVLRKLKKTPVDHIVGHCSLVFELEYPESLKIVKEQGYLDRLLRFETKNKQTAEKFSKMRKNMLEYLENF